MLAAGLSLLGLTHWRFVAVQTNSMVPTFNAGDALLITSDRTATIQQGDIITYRSQNDPQMTISHRVVSVLGDSIITAGDAQKIHDPSVSQSQIVGHAVAVAPRLGIIITWLHTPYGLAAALYGPAAILCGTELWRVRKQLQLPVYSIG
ncbi:MAG: signal peptidase I [Patescibacteria group bacterium]|nr:signal peptidase I [Patescibacteria group bacterium]